MAEFVCANCGRRFRAKPSKRPKFCSQECYRAARRASLPHAPLIHDVHDRAWLGAQIRSGTPVDRIAYLSGCSPACVYRVAHQYRIPPYLRRGGSRVPEFRVSSALARKLDLPAGAE